MPLLTAADSVLLMIDLQSRLMPAITDGPATLANAARLLSMARILGLPVIATEQNRQGLGGTVPDLSLAPGEVFAKMTFDATRARSVRDALPLGRTAVIAGCEAHVCVLQTAMGLLGLGRPVAVVADAVGSRRMESHQAALRRLERHGAEIVTTEMVLFEWIGDCEHPLFRQMLALVR